MIRIILKKNLVQLKGSVVNRSQTKGEPMKSAKLLTIAVAATLLTGTATLAHAGDAVAGKAKYDMLCVSCHGATGAGDGVAAAALNPKPRNLTVTTKTDAELHKVIKEGGAANALSASMPAWGAMLPDPDIDNVIAYVRSLKKK